MLGSVFQFPSSGKGHSKLSLGNGMYSLAALIASFNSLQAGRGIQSRVPQEQLSGRHAIYNVSIPFKREGAFKDARQRF